MVVFAVATKTGVTLEVLGDGYFRGRTASGTLTIRLNREGADTRVVVRAEEGQRRDRQLVSLAWLVALVSGLSFVSHHHGPRFFAAVGMLFASVLVAGAARDWLHGRAAERSTQREILVHDVLRAMEDAAESQGMAGGYRVAPGLDAVATTPEPDAGAEKDTDELVQRRARLR